MITILSIETATNACSAALWTEGKIFSRFQIAPRQHAKLILPMIQSIMEESKTTLSAINTITVGQGPGSFMGVRLGIGIAQGLAFGLQIPIIPLSTLQVLAQTAYEKMGEKQVLAGWDARMGEIYWGVYACDQWGIMQAVQPDSLSKSNQIDELLKTTYIPVGNAWVMSENNSCAELYPDARSMISIARARYDKKEFVSPEYVEPCYLRNRVTYT